MECLAETPHHTSNGLEKPRYSYCQDKNSIYLQPPTRQPITYNRSYRKPTVKIDSKTTYGLSYMKFDCVPLPRFAYGKHERRIASNSGKFDSDTIYKLSYEAVNGKLAKPFIPKSCLSISGSHDMTTIHMTSYINPGYAKVKPYKPFQGKVCNPVAIDSTTITKESYQHIGKPIAAKKSFKPQFWQTKSKTDYKTTSQLSYQGGMPVFRKAARAVHYRPCISAQIEKDTVYKTSYQVPGRFISKESDVCK